MPKKPTPVPANDWTNSPSSRAWSKYYNSQVNPDGSAKESAKKAALKKMLSKLKKSKIVLPTSPTH